MNDTILKFIHSGFSFISYLQSCHGCSVVYKKNCNKPWEERLADNCHYHEIITSISCYSYHRSRQIIKDFKTIQHIFYFVIKMIFKKEMNLSNTIHNAKDGGPIKLCKLHYVDKNNESLFTCFWIVFQFTAPRLENLSIKNI